MATKTLTITEDAYEMLKRQKGESESFSQVIRKLAMRKGDIMQFYGAWKDLMSDKEAKQMKHEIGEMDRRSTKLLLKKLERK